MLQFTFVRGALKQITTALRSTHINAELLWALHSLIKEEKKEKHYRQTTFPACPLFMLSAKRGEGRKEGACLRASDEVKRDVYIQRRRIYIITMIHLLCSCLERLLLLLLLS